MDLVIFLSHMCGKGSIILKKVYDPGRDPVAFSTHISSQGSLSHATLMQETAGLLGGFCDFLGRTAEGGEVMSSAQSGPLLLILVKQSQLRRGREILTRGGGCST